MNTPRRPKRNRSQEAIASGKVMRAFVISLDVDKLLNDAAETIPATKAEALEKLVRAGAKRLKLASK